MGPLISATREDRWRWARTSHSSRAFGLIPAGHDDAPGVHSGKVLRRLETKAGVGTHHQDRLAR